MIRHLPAYKARFGIAFFGLVVLAASTAYAQDRIDLYKPFDRYRYVPELPSGPGNPAPLPQPSTDVKGDQTTLVGALKGVVIISDPEAVDPGMIDVEGIEVRSDELYLLKSPSFQNVVTPYLGQPVSVYTLNQMIRDIILYYRQNDRPVVDISVPEQDITDGTVQLLVTEARVGKVMVEGARFFNPQILVDQVFVNPGDELRESVVLEDLRWLYRDPFRKVNVELTPGDNRGETDLIFKVEDRLPARIFTGYEDTGNQALGRERTFYGFNLNNAFDRDDDLGYQYTTSSDFKALRAHSFYYTTALFNRDVWTVYGSHAEFNSDLGMGLNQDGVTWQILIRRLRELEKQGNYEHSTQLGFDYKRTNTNLDFGGASVFANFGDVVQMMAGYQGLWTSDESSAFFSTETYFSPGHIGGRNNGTNYESIRPGADPGYVYTRLFAQYKEQVCDDLQLVARFTGQLSEGNLLPTELLGMGGYSSIRGYDFYSVTGDSGFFINFEAWSRPIYFDECQESALQFLTFYDFGNTYTHTVFPGVPRTFDLAGTGVGFRYQHSDKLSVRCDYGWQIHELPFLPDNSRFHVGVVVSR